MSGRACSCTQTDDTFSAAAALNTPAASAATSGAPTTAAPAAAPAAAAATTAAAAAVRRAGLLGLLRGRRSATRLGRTAGSDELGPTVDRPRLT